MTEFVSHFSYPVRIYFEDTDAGGLVYHANYLNYAERARTEMLRTSDYDHARMVKELRHVLVVKHCDVDYRAPALLDDEIHVETALVSVKGASLKVDQRIFRDGDLLVAIKITLACVNMDSMRPARLPAPFMDAVRAFQLKHAA